MSYNYDTGDILFVVIIGLVVGFMISMVAFYKRTDNDYYRLKDKCKGVIGIVEDGKGVELDFVCVGGL